MNLMSKEHSVTRQQVRGQLWKDFIGKDSHRGVTLTYSWLANQFGHFSLGFIPTWIFTVLLGKESSLSVAIWVSVVWFLFEAYNLTAPIWLSRRFKSVTRPAQKVNFKPDTKNLLYDTFTDLAFFWLGACTAGLIIQRSTVLWIALGVLGCFIIVAAPYWYLTKIYLQAAQYPFQFRLAQWDKTIDAKSANDIENFRKEESTGNHLFVFGPANAGKSTLCVGIATEMSIKHRPCLYATAMKLFRMFFEPPEASNTSDTFWTWHKAKYLVIDDVNTGDPVTPDVIDTEQFRFFLSNSQFGKSNIESLMEKNVIWVMGSEHESKMRHESWKELLKQLGIDESKITTINLKAPDPKTQRNRGSSESIKEEYGYRKQSLPSE